MEGQTQLGHSNPRAFLRKAVTLSERSESKGLRLFFAPMLLKGTGFSPYSCLIGIPEINQRGASSASPRSVLSLQKTENARPLPESHIRISPARHDG
jgi:hypothetical protein